MRKEKSQHQLLGMKKERTVGVIEYTKVFSALFHSFFIKKVCCKARIFHFNRGACAESAMGNA